MFRTARIAVFAAVLGSLALAACAPAAAPTAEVINQIQTQVVTQVVEKTSVVVVTATPEAKATELPAGSVQINAGGATFPLPLYTQWTYAYQYVDPSVVINYQGVGSGTGKSNIIAGTFDYAGSDSLLTADEYTKGADLQMYPMVASAVVPVYNITYDKFDAAKDKPLPALILDRATLANIYLGKIKTWNDPAIVALNPDLKDHLPAKNITAVHRSDGSGTTEIFTNALTAFSEEWAAGPKAGSAVQWPVDKAGNGIGGKGNQGVAGAVLNTPNSIGYVELNYATANKMNMASLVNKAGKTVVANAASIASDMADYKDAFTDKLTAKIVDGAGEGSWPITGYTYIILHTTSMKDCTKASKILEFINWSLNDATAAKAAATLGYSVLPDAIKAKVVAKLGEVTCGGQPVMKK
jgi:phosphate transport system substrate-binding protein